MSPSSHVGRGSVFKSDLPETRTLAGTKLDNPCKKLSTVYLVSIQLI